MKNISTITYALALLTIACSAGAGRAEEIARYGLETSFVAEERGIDYAVFGESVISQNELKAHSAFDIDILPEGSEVLRALLYWVGEREGHKAASTKVALRDAEGRNHAIYAEKIWTNVVSGLLYVCRADISAKITGNGAYELSYIEADPLEPVTFGDQKLEKAHYTIGGWGLVLVYRDPGETRTRQVHIQDGMLYIPSGEALRTGIYGDKKIGHDISKEDVYPDAKIILNLPGAAKSPAIDMTIISGYGHPLDGGSVLLDGKRLTGWEDFVANAGWAWDINRNIIFLDESERKNQYEIEFSPDYNSVLPIAIVTKVGPVDDEEILRLASSYILRADDVGKKAFYDTRDPDYKRKEYAAKGHIKNILNAKALAAIRSIADRGLRSPYELYIDLGKLYLEQRRYDLAEIQLLAAMKIHPDDYQVYYQLGRLYYRERDIDRAIDCFKKAGSLSNKNAEILQNLGTCYSQKGLWFEAVGHFEQAIRIDPENMGALLALREIYDSQYRLKDKVRIIKLIDDIKRRKK